MYTLFRDVLFVFMERSIYIIYASEKLAKKMYILMYKMGEF